MNELIDLEQQKLIIEAKLLICRDFNEYDILTKCRIDLDYIIKNIV